MKSKSIMHLLFGWLIPVQQEPALSFPMLDLAKPKNQVAEVLFELLMNKEITFERTYANTGIINLGARISDLRFKHNLIISCQEKEFYNKHGRKSTYGVWTLHDKRTGLEVYKSICNQ